MDFDDMEPPARKRRNKKRSRIDTESEKSSERCKILFQGF
jgi:hypothetical protein